MYRKFLNWNPINFAGGLQDRATVLTCTLSKFLYRVFFLFFVILNATWCVPLILIVRAIKPILLVRFGTIYSTRIGHFVIDAALYLNIVSGGSEKYKVINLFYLTPNSCNIQWSKMVKRQLNIHQWVRYLILFNKFIPGGREHILPTPSLTDAGFDNTLVNLPKHFAFTQKEDSIAKEWLRHRGWSDGEPFVCLHVRDASYLEKNSSYKESFSYHDYRDSEIESYIDAIKSLLDRGYWVVRLGKITRNPLPFSHQRLIDYPFVLDKDDLLDIWLPAKCHFFISTSSGPIWIAAIFKRPVVVVNGLPLIPSLLSVDRIWVPKNLYWSDTGKKLTLTEYYRHSYGDSRSYDEAGIVIENLSALEIKSAVMECEKRTNDRWFDSDLDKVNQAKYWNTAVNTPEFLKIYKLSRVGKNTRAGSSWLMSQEDNFYE